MLSRTIQRTNQLKQHLTRSTFSSSPSSPPAISTMSSTPDLTLYTFGTPNGHKASVTLEELGVPYKTEAVNISQNTQKEPWFLAINPNGRIPALKDGSQRVFETGAIMMYLTDKYDTEHKISFPFGSSDYYESVSWIMWQMGGLGPMQGQANHFKLMAGAKSEYGIKRYMDETKRLLGVLDARLSEEAGAGAGEGKGEGEGEGGKREYLVGPGKGRYSTADIASFCWANYAPYLKIDLAEFPRVQDWCARIDAREAVQRGKKVPGGGKTKEELDEMFGKMAEKIDAMNNTDKH